MYPRITSDALPLSLVALAAARLDDTRPEERGGVLAAVCRLRDELDEVLAEYGVGGKDTGATQADAPIEPVSSTHLNPHLPSRPLHIEYCPSPALVSICVRLCVVATAHGVQGGWNTTSPVRTDGDPTVR